MKERCLVWQSLSEHCFVESFKGSESRFYFRGRPELSSFSRAYIAYAARETVEGCCTLF